MHTFDDICDFAPPLNRDSRMLEWANPMGALPSVSIDVFIALRQQSLSSISFSTSAQHRTNPGAWRPGHANQNTTDQPTSSTEDNQLILAGAASPPSEVVTQSLEDGTPVEMSGASTLATDGRACDDIRNDRYECIECHSLVGQQPESKSVCEYEELCCTSMPTALSGKAASSTLMTRLVTLEKNEKSEGENRSRA